MVLLCDQRKEKKNDLHLNKHHAFWPKTLSIEVLYENANKRKEKIKFGKLCGKS